MWLHTETNPTSQWGLPQWLSGAKRRQAHTGAGDTSLCRLSLTLLLSLQTCVSVVLCVCCAVMKIGFSRTIRSDRRLFMGPTTSLDVLAHTHTLTRTCQLRLLPSLSFSLYNVCMYVCTQASKPMMYNIFATLDTPRRVLDDRPITTKITEACWLSFLHFLHSIHPSALLSLLPTSTATLPRFSAPVCLIPLLLLIARK